MADDRKCLLIASNLKILGLAASLQAIYKFNKDDSTGYFDNMDGLIRKLNGARGHRQLIILTHSNPDAIFIGSQKLPWEEFAAKLKDSPAFPLVFMEGCRAGAKPDLMAKIGAALRAKIHGFNWYHNFQAKSVQVKGKPVLADIKRFEQLKSQYADFIIPGSPDADVFTAAKPPKMYTIMTEWFRKERNEHSPPGRLILDDSTGKLCNRRSNARETMKNDPDRLCKVVIDCSAGNVPLDLGSGQKEDLLEMMR